MAKVIQCPHYWTDGLAWGCLEGKFPVDCERCNHPDKKYIEVYSSNTTKAL